MIPSPLAIAPQGRRRALPLSLSEGEGRVRVASSDLDPTAGAHNVRYTPPCTSN